MLVTADGKLLGTVSRSYSISYPHPGWSEQDPQDWWNAFSDALDEVAIGMDKYSIKGIGIAGQMHGLIILDENDKIIRPAILWNDGRTDQQTNYLNEVIGKNTLAKLTANIAFAGFTAPKLLWVKENEPENFKRIHKIMLPKDYINYKLTGVHCTDYSDASGMLLLDVQNKRWSQKMLEICSISEKQLPKLYESYEVVGTLLPEIADRLGLDKRVSVIAGAGDNAAAAVGTGTVFDGRCNISLGTSGTVFISSDKFAGSKNNALHSFCHANGKYHLMGCILSAASCNKWFCEDILKTSDFAAEQINITEDKLGNNHVYFLPYLMGERSPINDTDARGTFIGMRLDTKRSDMLQAVLEGVAFAIKDNFTAANDSGIIIQSSSLCGGGAKSDLWQKILCNVLDITIKLPQSEEGPGYGAAMLAMVSCGEFESVEQCADQLIRYKKEIHPEPELVLRYKEQYEKYSKLYPTLRDLFKKIK